INPKLAGMGTTVTSLLLAEGKLHIAHIGDSRAYRLRDGVFEQVSVDHTFVQRLIDEGRLRPEEAETHPHKNVLMRVLGDVDASPELDLDTMDVQPGERWLLCSDGLNYVAGHVVERTVRETKDLRECVETLVNLTLEAGSPDNVTVVMVEIVEETPDDVSTAAVDVVPPAAVTQAETAESKAEAPEAADAVGEVPQAPKPDVGKPDAGEQGTSTDPHLGEHLSAEVLRQELSSRPHELVGAAATAAESGSIPTIAGRTVARRAATVLTHKADAPVADDAEEILEPAKPRRWVTWSIAASILLVLTVGLWLGYAWTQTRYYIGEFDSRVAIYNGVSQRLGPIQLSTLEAVTEIRMDSLPLFSQQRVRQTVPARDLYDAQRIVKNLEGTGTIAPAEECLTASPTATAAPTAGTTPTAPAPPPDASNPAAVPTPTASTSPTALCEGVR
ncbi:MAG: protein phosphatase 2C domain-containing protein, partial [Pseudarthrobacter sp.]